MRTLVLAAIAAAALLGAWSARGAAGPPTLRVTYWGNGANAMPTSTWTLRCDPPRGTLARPGTACRRLASGGPKLFAPVPADTACTQIYGGPQKARAVGIVGGRKVWATFTRSDGCQIERWNRLSPWLLPPGGGAP